MWAYMAVPKFVAVLPVLQVILGHADGYSWCRLVLRHCERVRKLAMTREVVLGIGR